MALRGALRGPDGNVFLNPASALHMFARTVTRDVRRPVIIAIFLALLVGCGSYGLTFRPSLLPIEITLTGSGTIVVSASPEIATPLGTFSLNVPLASWTIHPGETLLAILHQIIGLSAQRGQEGGNAELARQDQRDGSGETAASGAWVEDIIKIERPPNMHFLLNGPYNLTPEGSNIAKLKLLDGTTWIKIKTSQAGFSAETTSFPAASVTCPPSKNGTVTCVATVTGGAGPLSYLWFDCYQPSGCAPLVGSRNSPQVTLKPGDHLITVTVRDSNDNSATSAATPVKVPASTSVASAPRGPPVNDATVH